MSNNQGDFKLALWIPLDFFRHVSTCSISAGIAPSRWSVGYRRRLHSFKDRTSTSVDTELFRAYAIRTRDWGRYYLRGLACGVVGSPPDTPHWVFSYPSTRSEAHPACRFWYFRKTKGVFRGQVHGGNAILQRMSKYANPSYLFTNKHCRCAERAND